MFTSDTSIIARLRKRRLLFYILLSFILVLSFLPETSLASYAPGYNYHGSTVAGTNMPSSPGVLNNTLRLFQTAVEKYKDTFANAGLSLLFYLTVINLFWRSASLMFRGNNVADIFFELIRTVMIYGFFYYLLTNIVSVPTSGD